MKREYVFIYHRVENGTIFQEFSPDSYDTPEAAADAARAWVKSHKLEASQRLGYEKETTSGEMVFMKRVVIIALYTCEI